MTEWFDMVLYGDFAAGDIGVLCSFGAGYSIGSVVLRRL